MPVCTPERTGLGTGASLAATAGANGTRFLDVPHTTTETARLQTGGVLNMGCTLLQLGWFDWGQRDLN